MMLFNKTIRIVCVFILLFNLFTVSGQVTSFYPGKPEWNDELFVKYDAGDSKALLKGNEVVYLRIYMNFQNGDSKVIVLKTDRKDNVYQCSFKVPESLTSAKAVFFTLTREDNKNSLIIKVYGNGKPVENANIDAMPYFEPNSDSLFQKEMKNYPDNYKAYGIYFTKIIPP
ncbi:MAG: hypothetical protein GXO47_00880, partial [Chlorobi bacterium]|nr:hypothetical protein [Chlorobiota bacterium]